MESKRNGTIDLIRFLGSVAIMIFHSNAFARNGAVAFIPRPHVMVEFFFMVSGYLMACSVYKNTKKTPHAAIGQETISFMKHKISSLFPEYVISFLASFIIYEIATGSQGFLSWCRDFITGLPDGLMLSMTGLGCSKWNIVLWYISAMMIVMLIFYPWLRKYFKAFSCIAAPVLAITVYVFFYFQFKGSITGPYKIIAGFLYKGLLKALGGVSLGISAFFIIEWMKKLNLNIFGKLIITIIQICLWTVMICYAFDPPAPNKDILMVFLCFINVILAFSQQGILYGIFNNKICYFLGRLSLPLYMCHGCFRQVFKYISKVQVSEGTFGWDSDPDGAYIRMLVIYIAASAAFALFTLFSADLLRKRHSSLKNAAQ